MVSPPDIRQICNAIQSRRLLRVTYRGAERLVEPFCHGVTSDNHELLIVFQRSGATSSGASIGWKTLVVRDLSVIEPLDISFSADRRDFRPGVSKQLTQLHCSA